MNRRPNPGEIVQVNRLSPQAVGLWQWWPAYEHGMAPSTGVSACRERAGRWPYGGSNSVYLLNSGTNVSWVCDREMGWVVWRDGGSSNWYTTATVLPSWGIFLSWWMYWDSYADDGKACLSYHNSPEVTRGWQITPNGTSGAFELGLNKTTSWLIKSFPRPTAQAWHHYGAYIDRSGTGTLQAWVDGVSQTMTPVRDDAASWSSPTTGYSIYLMSTAGNAVGSLIDLRVYYSNNGNLDALSRHMYDPSTRWDLYENVSELYGPYRSSAGTASSSLALLVGGGDMRGLSDMWA